MKKFKRICLMAVIILGPASLFYFFSRGDYHFKQLPYLCDLPEGKPLSYDAFNFKDQNDQPFTNADLKDKIVIVNFLDAHCTEMCKTDRKFFKYEIYNKILSNKGYSDVVIVTETNDSSAQKRKVMQELLGVDGSRWKFVYSNAFSFFDAPINKSNPFRTKDSKFKTGNVHERCVLILDKQLKIRSFFDISHNIELKRILEELQLLKKEYFKKKKRDEEERKWNSDQWKWFKLALTF